jgi:transposase
MAGGRPLRIDWAAADTAAALERAYHAAPDQHVARRLQALWSLRQGHGIRETVERLGLSERSMQLWVRWYRDGGLAAVAAQRHGQGRGRQAWLDAAQEQALRDQLDSGAVRTAWDARDWLQEQFGVTYTRKGVYGVLKRLRAHPKVPRPSNPKSSAAVQEAWKKGGSPTPSVRRASLSLPA